MLKGIDEMHTSEYVLQYRYENISFQSIKLFPSVKSNFS